MSERVVVATGFYDWKLDGVLSDDDDSEVACFVPPNDGLKPLDGKRVRVVVERVDTPDLVEREAELVLAEGAVVIDPKADGGYMIHGRVESVSIPVALRRVESALKQSHGQRIEIAIRALPSAARGGE